VSQRPDITQLKPLAFADLDGWGEHDHAAAFAAFRRGAAVLADHPPKSRALGRAADQLAAILAAAGRRPADISSAVARTFFGAHFAPHEVVSAGGGFYTGYYEPQLAGARAASAAYPIPLYRQPDDLREITPGSAGPALDPSFRFARRTAAGYAPFPDRAAIMAGALSGHGLELVHVADPVDAFFIHVQGAARIALAQGGTMRVTYAAKSGHPYTPIGRVLLERGELRPGEVTMQAIRAWLAAHPQERDGVLAANRSFIFFREAPVDDEDPGPVAAAKVPLTPGRSLAVDRQLHSFHAPVWVDTTQGDGTPWRRLMVAQDTGSAIVGPGRGDIYFGSGETAGAIAGAMNARGRFILFVPAERTP